MRNVWFIQEFPIDNKNKIIQENFHRYWLSIAQVKRICIHQQTKLAFCLFVALAADWDSKLHGTEMRSLISTRKRQEQDRRLFFFFSFSLHPWATLATNLNIHLLQLCAWAQASQGTFLFLKISQPEWISAIHRPKTMTGCPPKRLVVWTDFSSHSPNLISFSGIRAAQKLEWLKQGVK